VDRGSDRHGPLLDDELKHETAGTVHGGRSSHIEEWREAEPSGEDQPEVDRAPETALSGGVPAGMREQDVAGRTELASYLPASTYPAVREQLLEAAMSGYAPDEVVERLRRLPAGRTFRNVNEVWTALGGRVEQGRF
jgi:hypothetical protein